MRVSTSPAEHPEQLLGRRQAYGCSVPGDRDPRPPSFVSTATLVGEPVEVGFGQARGPHFRAHREKRVVGEELHGDLLVVLWVDRGGECFDGGAVLDSFSGALEGHWLERVVRRDRAPRISSEVARPTRTGLS